MLFRSLLLPLETVLCTRGEEALARPVLEQFQLALLDVDLETTNGIALGRQLKQANPDVVLVYISAYLEFAPEGYTVHAFRYLLKRDIERTLPLCLEAVLAEHAKGGFVVTDQYIHGLPPSFGATQAKNLS